MQINDILNMKLDLNKSHKDTLSDGLKDMGIDVYNNDLSHVNSSVLANNLYANTLGFDDDEVGFSNQAISDLINKNTYDFINAINGTNVINPVKPSLDDVSKNIADFVIENAGDDLDKLYQGKIGVINGFKQLGQMLNQDLKDCLDDTLKIINDKITELGGNILSMKV